MKLVIPKKYFELTIQTTSQKKYFEFENSLTFSIPGNSPRAGELKLAGAVRERPPTTPPLNKSRNAYTASLRILTTNERNLHNYLFNKISSKKFVPKLLLMHFIYLVSGRKKTYAKRPKKLEIRNSKFEYIFVTIFRILGVRKGDAGPNAPKSVGQRKLT